jgi:hypothetical protein
MILVYKQHQNIFSSRMALLQEIQKDNTPSPQKRNKDCTFKSQGHSKAVPEGLP